MADQVASTAGKTETNGSKANGAAAEEKKPAPKRQTKAAVEKVAKSYFDAVAARDAKAMADHWHAEGIDDLVPVGVMRGPGEVQAAFDELFRALPDLEFIVERVTADSKGAAVQWRASGTFTGGQYQGLEPTGRRVQVRGCDCIEVENGKLVRNTAYYDGMEFARGVGMLPQRDSGPERAMKSTFNAMTKVKRAVQDRRG
jgi:predicted ester cyclase